MNSEYGPFWRNIVYLVVVGSFIAANFGYEPALTFWKESWEAAIALVGSTVGLKYAKDVAMVHVQNKGSQNVDKGL